MGSAAALLCVCTLLNVTAATTSFPEAAFAVSFESDSRMIIIEAPTEMEISKNVKAAPSKRMVLNESWTVKGSRAEGCLTPSWRLISGSTLFLLGR